jgi:hypothetical protein
VGRREKPRRSLRAFVRRVSGEAWKRGLARLGNTEGGGGWRVEREKEVF